jgi:hypothetical protein
VSLLPIGTRAQEHNTLYSRPGIQQLGDGVPRRRDTMKKGTAIVSLLIGLFALTVQIHAMPQDSGSEVTQKISKTAQKAAVHAAVHYEGPPQFAQVEGTFIAFATNTSQPVLNIGDTFYFSFDFYNPILLTTQSVWLVSSSAQGPWVPAHSVPEKAAAIVCAPLNTDPSDPRQFCALPWQI